MNNLNPIIRVIEHIKEKRPELREEIEELRMWCIVYDLHFRKYIQVYKHRENSEFIETSSGVKIINMLDIIWNLDFLILSKALWYKFSIMNGEINAVVWNVKSIEIPPLHLWTEETADTIIWLIN